MARIRLETNTFIPEAKHNELGNRLIAAVSEVVGEPAAAMAVELFGGRAMRMANGVSNLAHVEVKGVEFPKDKAKQLIDAICPIVDDILGIKENNVYIAVVSNRLSMWRVNGDLC